jgi:membrane associated rhomboid family serine protease
MIILPVGVDRPYYRRPWVTYSIMIACTVIEIVRLSSRSPEEFVIALGFVPGYGSLLTLMSSMFVHGGLGHLIGNMLFLYVTGVKIEDALGWWRYLLLYLGSGVAANGVHVLFSGGIPLPSIGASGAIAGVMGAFTMLYPHSNVKLFYFFVFATGTYLITSWVYLGFWFLKEVLSLIYAASYSSVAFGAHVGGFAAGMIWCWAFFGWNGGEDLDTNNADLVYVDARGI